MKNVSRLLIPTALFFLTIKVANAQRIRLSETFEDVIKKRRFATVLVVIAKGEDALGIGAGFYYGNDGTIVTNRHVIKEFLTDKDVQIRVMSVKNGVLDDLELGYCGKANEPDICFLRSKKTSKKFFFPVNNSVIGVGHQVSTFGHCKEYFNHKRGKIIKFIKSSPNNFDEESQYGLERIITDLEICPGDSGGPIFTDRGDLVGINVGAGMENYKGNKRIKYVGASYNEITKMMQNNYFKPIPPERISIPKKKK